MEEHKGVPPVPLIDDSVRAEGILRNLGPGNQIRADRVTDHLTFRRQQAREHMIHAFMENHAARGPEDSGVMLPEMNKVLRIQHVPAGLGILALIARRPALQIERAEPAACRIKKGNNIAAPGFIRLIKQFHRFRS